MSRRERYSLFGLSVESEFDLGEASPHDLAPPDVVIRSGVVPDARRTTNDDEFIRFAGLGSFHISSGREIVASLSPSAPNDLLRVFLCGRAMAYLLRQRGWFPLHGSAVCVGDEAVIFVGSVGTGKSTTAAAFHSRGYSVLSDDVCPVRVVSGQCILQPGRPRVRLCEDAAREFAPLDRTAQFVLDKTDFQLVRSESPSCPRVTRIYLLADGNDFRVEPVSQMDAAIQFGKECFVRLRLSGPDVLESHLRDCSAIAGLHLTRRLVRPRSLARIRRIVDLVESDLPLRDTGSNPPAPAIDSHTDGVASARY